MGTTHPQDVFKHCPRCGVDTFVPLPRHRFRCESCGFFYYINEAAAVAALIENRKGELLLTARNREPKKGFLDLPGGFVDIGETAEDALRREIREELNLEITESRFFASAPNEYAYKGLTYFTLDLAFLCRVASFDEVRPADDVGGFVFRAPGAISIQEIGLDSIKKIVRGYLRSKAHS